jgi:hypothetical protein
MLSLTFVVVALAQAEAAPADAPAVEAAVEPAPAVVVKPEPCPESTTVLPQPQTGCPPKPWLRVARIGVELVLGSGLGALGVLTGMYVGLYADVHSGREGGAGVSIGAALGAALSAAPAVWAGGSIMGGDGSFGWTLLGGAAGTVLSGIVLAIKNVSATVGIAAALPVLGAIAGYELSSNARRPTPASSGVTIAPTVGLGSVGLAGSF